MLTREPCGVPPLSGLGLRSPQLVLGLFLVFKIEELKVHPKFEKNTFYSIFGNTFFVENIKNKVLSP